MNYYCRVSHTIANGKHTFTVQVQKSPFKRKQSLDKACNTETAEDAARKALRWATC